MREAFFFVTAAVLFGTSFVLIRGTSPFSDCGCSVYEKRRQRKIVGLLVFILGTFLTVIAVLSQGNFSSPSVATMDH